MKYGFLLVGFFWTHSILLATGYYVSPNGDDMNKGNKWFTPFKTLQKAAFVAKAGDTVYILKGDYYSNNEAVLHIENSGKENAWIVYKNYLNHKPVLHVNHKYGIRIQSANFISIEGLNIHSDTAILKANPMNDFTGIFIDGRYNSPCTHLKIFNNFIQKMSGNGIAANYFDYLTISYNKLFGNSTGTLNSAAIDLKNVLDVDGQDVYHNYIQGNVLQKNGQNTNMAQSDCRPAIQMNYNPDYITSAESRTLIHNNIIYNSGGGGLQAHGAVGCDIVNNTFYKNSESVHCREAEIRIANCSKFNVLNNIFYSSPAKPGNQLINATDIIFQNNMFYNFSSKDHGENDMIANPEFELTNDKDGIYNFRLKGNSPAINSGTDRLLSDVDFEGNIRKVDTHVDLGALEFTNRILPSLKNTKAGPQSKHIESSWSSLFTKDQKVYTIWNQYNLGFSIRVFDCQGDLVFEKIRPDNADASFEIDFNYYPLGFYTIFAYNSKTRFIERIWVQARSSPQ